MHSPLQVKLIRFYFRLVAPLFPKLAVYSAHKLFHYPVNSKRKNRNELPLPTPKLFDIPLYKDVTLQGYSWGEVNHPKVLLVHGWSTTSQSMTHFTDALLKSHYQVISYDALRHGDFMVHKEAKKIIEKELGKSAYPHPIKMAELPKGAELLDNPVNKMPAFSLDERYFFMPGFPQMSHPMVVEILEKLIPNKKETFRHTLTAQCKENIFIDIMEQMPKGVEFSSLPKLQDNGKDKKWEVTISVASDNKLLAEESFKLYTTLLHEKQIPYTLTDGI